MRLKLMVLFIVIILGVSAVFAKPKYDAHCSADGVSFTVKRVGNNILVKHDADATADIFPIEFENDSIVVIKVEEGFFLVLRKDGTSYDRWVVTQDGRNALAGGDCRMGA